MIYRLDRYDPLLLRQTYVLYCGAQYGPHDTLGLPSVRNGVTGVEVHHRRFSYHTTFSGKPRPGSRLFLTTCPRIPRVTLREDAHVEMLFTRRVPELILL